MPSVDYGLLLKIRLPSTAIIMILLLLLLIIIILIIIIIIIERGHDSVL